MLARMVLSSLFLALATTFPASADSTPPLSSTVATDQLETFFQVSPTDGNHSTADVNVGFQKIFADNGVGVEAALTTSPTDVVTFSTADGSASVTYNPNNDVGNVLPIQYGSAYNVTLTRASGETFKSTTTMPLAVNLVSPAPGADIKKTDAVHVSWLPVQPDINWQAQVQTNCENTNGAVAAGDDNASIDIPAGFASGCPGVVSIEVDLAFVNDGTGYGSFSGAEFMTVNFTYDNASVTSSRHAPSKAVMKSLLHQKNAKHVLVVQKR